MLLPSAADLMQRVSVPGTWLVPMTFANTPVDGGSLLTHKQDIVHLHEIKISRGLCGSFVV